MLIKKWKLHSLDFNLEAMVLEGRDALCINDNGNKQIKGFPDLAPKISVYSYYNYGNSQLEHITDFNSIPSYVPHGITSIGIGGCYQIFLVSFYLLTSTTPSYQGDN